MGDTCGRGPPSSTAGARSSSIGGGRRSGSSSRGEGRSYVGATYPGRFQGSQSIRSCAMAGGVANASVVIKSETRIFNATPVFLGERGAPVHEEPERLRVKRARLQVVADIRSPRG